MKAKVLIVEDDRDIAEIIAFNLETAGYEVDTETDGLSGYEKIVEELPDIVLLDLNLPKLSGIEICKYIRENVNTKDLPVIMLTARSQETDKIIGLNIGADDYITKPCSMKELLARVNALLRRTKPTQFDIISFNGLEINDSLKTVKIDNEIVNMTPTEFKLIMSLIKVKGRVLSRVDLLDTVWGINSSTETRTVDVAIKRLRDKLGDHKDFIQTVKGTGYRVDIK
ncbi:MAG: response regulator [Melioribacteraceae bacterium]|nr:response regulator [Melioribacteraceae bacterium]